MTYNKMPFTKDFIIVGGGIAGLYCAYKINQVNPNQTILLIDSDKELGGRIRTHYEKGFQVEKGAARFSENHTELLKLIGEFGLTDDLSPISNKRDFVYQKKRISYKLEDKFQDILRKGLKKDYLMKITLYQLCVDLYGSEEANKIQALSGYDSEFIRLNAYAALHMFQDDMFGNDQYYVLKSGLSELIKRMETKIRESPSVEIMLKTDVTEVQNRRIVAKTGDKEHKFSSLVIICAIPYLSLRKFPIFQELEILHSVKPISLCRIYAKYPLVNGKSWFHGMTKTTTDNRLRYIIPMSEEDGIIMYYTDLYIADMWRNWSNVSDDKLTEMLHTELHRVFPGKKIPNPLKIKTYHWKAGVHAWRPNHDFQKIAKQMIQPLENDIYVVGECYSTKQDWIEGSLRTGNKVLAKLEIVSDKRGSKKKKSLKK